MILVLFLLFVSFSLRFRLKGCKLKSVNWENIDYMYFTYGFEPNRPEHERDQTELKFINYLLGLVRYNCLGLERTGPDMN